jgi:carbamate kinase
VPLLQLRRSLDVDAITVALRDGAVVIDNGGGGVAVVRDDERGWCGVEAVIDKDLSAAMLAVELRTDSLVILTDVPGVAVHFDQRGERWLARTTTTELSSLAADGMFGIGSMGPKVDAAIRLVDATGGTACIAALEQVEEVLARRAGTRVHGTSSS